MHRVERQTPSSSSSSSSQAATVPKQAAGKAHSNGVIAGSIAPAGGLRCRHEGYVALYANLSLPSSAARTNAA